MQRCVYFVSQSQGGGGRIRWHNIWRETYSGILLTADATFSDKRDTSVTAYHEFNQCILKSARVSAAPSNTTPRTPQQQRHRRSGKCFLPS